MHTDPAVIAFREIYCIMILDYSYYTLIHTQYCIIIIYNYILTLTNYFLTFVTN